jgi:hypothetical protein
MSVTGIHEVYAELLRYAGTQPRVVVLSAFQDGADATRYQTNPPPETTYSGAVKALRAARALGPLSMVRLTAIGRDVVVQRTDGRRSSRTVVAGHDPTLFGVGGQSCEILDLTFFRLPHPVREDGRNPVIVRTRIKTDALPSVAESREIARTIQHLTRQDSVTVEIRTDTWFIWEAPLWDPFTPYRDQEPPTHREYVARGGIFCTGDETGIRCSPMRFTDK